MNTNVKDKKFLIVDDDSDDVCLFTEALTSVAPKTLCFSASDGGEALRDLEKERISKPDIIFLDLNMPEMNGWQCLTKLKSLDRFKDIPVIIHTTSTSSIDKNHARTLGAHCFFTKPDDFSILKKMLEIVIDKLNEDAADKICDEVYRFLKLN